MRLFPPYQAFRDLLKSHRAAFASTALADSLGFARLIPKALLKMRCFASGENDRRAETAKGEKAKKATFVEKSIQITPDAMRSLSRQVKNDRRKVRLSRHCAIKD